MNAIQYQVLAQAIERDGKKYALIEIIDESENLNNWRINPAGKARALAGLLETPLLGPPNLGHGAIDVVGRPVDFVSNHATNVLYEIKDPAIWESIRAGDWGPVSPELTFLQDHTDPDGTHVIDEWRFDHVAFVEKGAYPDAGVKATCTDDPRLCGFSKAVTAALQSHSEELDKDVAHYSPRGKQVDREKIGGHPTAGVIVKNSIEATNDTLSAADAWNTADCPDEFFAVVPDDAKGPDGKKSLRKLPLASVQKKGLDPDIIRNALARFNQTDFAGTGVLKDDALAKICSAAKKFDIQSELCGTAGGSLHKEVDACMPCEHEKVIAELTETKNKLESEIKEIKTKTIVAAKDVLATIEAEFKVVKAENEALKVWKAAQEEAEHMKRVQGVVDLRIKTGVLDTKSVQAAIESLKKLPNEALDEMHADLEAVQAKFESLPAGPKARLIPSVSARFNPTQATVGDLVGKKVGEA